MCTPVILFASSSVDYTLKVQKQVETEAETFVHLFTFIATPVFIIFSVAVSFLLIFCPRGGRLVGRFHFCCVKGTPE